jgi:hypothetical protein
VAKRDLKKEMRDLYGPSASEVVRIDVPTMNFVMIDGHGDPNSSTDYASAVQALFALSYALKFAVKKGPQAIDYTVMPLEGLWWADDLDAFSAGDRAQWQWTMMIMQPSFIGHDLVTQTQEAVMTKKRLPALESVRFESFTEGPSAQILHVGPFTTEGPTIARIHRLIVESGGRPRGKHHEIYLSDITKADPARWRTVIRQPYQM